MSPYDRRVEPSADRRPEYQHTFVTDAGYSRRLADASFRMLLLGRRGAGLVGGVLLVVVGTWILGGITVVGAAVVVVLLVAVPGALLVRIRRQLSAQLPAGTVCRAGLGPDVLWLESPHGSSETSYRAFRGVQVRGEFVVLEHRSNVRTIYSRALFPGDVVDELRARVAAAQDSTTASV